MGDTTAKIDISNRSLVKASLIVGIVTALATATTTVWSVRSGLSGELDNWKQQRKFERAESYLDKRIAHMEEIQYRLHDIEFTLNKVRITGLEAGGLFANSLATTNTFSEIPEIDEWIESTEQFHRKLAELKAAGKITEVYFGMDATKAFKLTVDALEKDYLSSPDVTGRLKEFDREKDKDPKKFYEELVRATPQRIGKGYLDERDELTSAMLQSISEAQRAIYQEIE